MRTLKSATKFVLTLEEYNHIQEVENIIDLIYNAMEPNETFLGQGEYNMQDLADFFSDFIKALEKGIGVDGQATIECEKIN